MIWCDEWDPLVKAFRRKYFYTMQIPLVRVKKHWKVTAEILTRMLQTNTLKLIPADNWGPFIPQGHFSELELRVIFPQWSLILKVVFPKNLIPNHVKNKKLFFGRAMIIPKVRYFESRRKAHRKKGPYL